MRGHNIKTDCHFPFKSPIQMSHSNNYPFKCRHQSRHYINSSGARRLQGPVCQQHQEEGVGCFLISLPSTILKRPICLLIYSISGLNSAPCTLSKHLITKWPLCYPLFSLQYCSGVCILWLIKLSGVFWLNYASYLFDCMRRVCGRNFESEKANCFTQKHAMSRTTGWLVLHGLWNHASSM